MITLRGIFGFGLASLSVSACAAALSVSSAFAGPFDEVSGLLDTRVSVGDGDFQMGLRAGGETKWGRSYWAAFLDAEGRPFPKKIRIAETPSLTYQYREYRWSFGPGFTVAYPVVSWMMLTGGAGRYRTDGNFRGSSREPISEWSTWWEAGLRFPTDWEGASWQLVYQREPLPYMAPHRVALQFGVRF